MAFKTVMATLALGMVMFGSTAAQAADVHLGVRIGGVNVHVHGKDCRHDSAPEPQGRYETRTVSRWVEGHYEKVWVPEVCREKHRRHSRVTKCTGGYYEQQWVEGYYQQVQEQVWVPYSHDDGWRTRRVHTASYRR